MKGRSKTVVLVRHSERPHFGNLAREQYNSVGLTDNGIKEAEAFGKHMVTEGKLEAIRIHSWGLKRCEMTAEAVARGVMMTNCKVVGPAPIRLPSPVADRREFDRILDLGRWDEFLINWLEYAEPEPAMIPAREYSCIILDSLLDGGFLIPIIRIL
jgi:broad specificity phosphatase PhoE